MIEWWAYMHVNDTLQLKRYWGDLLDLQEADESPFIAKRTEVFEANSQEAAIAKARELLGWNT